MLPPDDLTVAPYARGEWVRLRTLINLRWIAIAGQLLAVLTAVYGFGIRLHLDLCLTAIFVSAAMNLGALIVYPASTRLQHRQALLTLIFDLGQLAFLLYLTGGLNNPFAILIVAPAVIGATVLPRRSTVLVLVSTVALTTLLGHRHLPLITAGGEWLRLPPLLITGMWVSLLISVAFLSLYARRVTSEILSMSQALAATQLALEREQKLTALGGVVAAAAHELGTPLATIKLASAELAAEVKDNPDLSADVALIRSQAERCSSILVSMGRTGKDDLHLRHAPLTAVVAEAAEPHLGRGIEVVTRVAGRVAGEDAVDKALLRDQPQIRRRPEIIHGLRNLVQNAVDFARSTVRIDIDWTADTIRITVGDDGAGFPPELIGRIGDPFVRGRGEKRGQERLRPGYEGMGLGLFIAKTLLERTGATVIFANGRGDAAAAPAAEPGEGRPTGAIVALVWRRAEIEPTRAETRGALGRNESIAG